MPLWTPHLWIPDAGLIAEAGPALGLTMMARTFALRAPRAASGAFSGYSTLTWRAAQANNTISSTHTFSESDIGASDINRYVIVGAHAINHSVTSVTVNGVSASAIVTTTYLGGTFGLYIAAVPTGTGNVSIVVGNSGSAMASIGHWTVMMASAVAHDTASNTSESDASIDATIDIPANGFCVSMSVAYADTASHSINASFTEHAELVNGADIDAAWSRRETVSAATGVTVTSTWSPASNGAAIVAASFNGNGT